MLKVIWGTTPTGCVVPTNRKLNADGYYRVQFGSSRKGSTAVMYHRHVWLSAGRVIPDGYEIDHMCRNRACQNIDHLQCLTRTDHLVKTNKERYSVRYETARTFWTVHNCTGTELGLAFEVSTSTACGWIRGWKMEGVETIPKGSRASQPEAPSSVKTDDDIVRHSQQWEQTQVDELQIAVRTRELADKMDDFSRRAMKEVEVTLKVKCPLDTDCKVGRNWAETH